MFDIGPVPHYPPEPMPQPAPAIALSPADRAVLEAMGYDALLAALSALQDEVYAARRRKGVTLVPTAAVLRLNGLLDLAGRMTAGVRGLDDIVLLPEANLLSPFELARPLEIAVARLFAVARHRPQPHDPAWRGALSPTPEGWFGPA